MTCRGARGPGLSGLVLAAVCVTLLVPLAVVDVPPLGDYPNHLARIFVLAALPHDPVLARFYAAHWGIIPNLGVDLLGPPLLHVLPVHIAGRCLIALSVLLPVLGAIAYNTALRRRLGRPDTATWWPLGAALAAYNASELEGFLNFSLSLGLALCLAAVWLRWRDARSWATIAVTVLGTPVLFFCHLMGLVFFGFLAAGAEFDRWAQERTLAAALRRGAGLAAVFLVPAVLYAMSDLRSMAGDALFLSPGAKLAELLTPFVNYSGWLDTLTAGAALAVAIAGCTRLRTWPGPAGWAAAALSIAWLAAPFGWKGTYGLDERFDIMLGFVLFAGVVPRRLPAWAPILLATLFVARMGVLTATWAGYARDVADVRIALAPVQPGQSVYVAEAGLNEASRPVSIRLSNGVRSDEHIGALALIDHRAWWPFEFDNESQQPLRTLPRYGALALRVGSLPTREQAAVANVCGFDWVLLTGADAAPDLPASRFRVMVRAGYAALYSITQCKEEQP